MCWIKWIKFYFSMVQGYISQGYTLEHAHICATWHFWTDGDG